MRIVCIGGGPAGLAFALLMKRLAPGHEITVVGHSREDDPAAWGAPLSDTTRAHLRRCDTETADALEAAIVRQDEVILEFKGRSIRSRGQGFAGIGRQRLAEWLQARCEALGVRLEPDRDELPEVDLVVASDGANPVRRQAYGDVLRPRVSTRPNRLLRLRTPKPCDAPTFVFERTGSVMGIP